jgi:hypothetical protein
MKARQALQRALSLKLAPEQAADATKALAALSS